MYTCVLVEIRAAKGEVFHRTHSLPAHAGRRTRRDCSAPPLSLYIFFPAAVNCQPKRAYLQCLRCRYTSSGPPSPLAEGQQAAFVVPCNCPPTAMSPHCTTNVTSRKRSAREMSHTHTAISNKRHDAKKQNNCTTLEIEHLPPPSCVLPLKLAWAQENWGQ